MVDAGEIVFRAERKLGQLSKKLEKASPHAKSGRGKVGPSLGPTKKKARAEVGIKKQRAHDYERVAEEPDDAVDASRL